MFFSTLLLLLSLIDIELFWLRSSSKLAFFDENKMTVQLNLILNTSSFWVIMEMIMLERKLEALEKRLLEAQKERIKTEAAQAKQDR